MIRLRSLIAILLLALIGAACAPGGDGEIVVFAASSLTDAFTEIASAYEAANPGSRVILNFGASSQLAAQIIEGAPADVYASANEAQMARVIDEAGVAGDPLTFASNRLVIIVPRDNPANITAPHDLADSGLRLVLAVPGVPVRDYADESLMMLAAGDTAWLGAVYANLVSEEDNVRLAVGKVMLGEADAAIVYTSDVTPDVADDLITIPIPAAQNIVATYPIAALQRSPHPDQAERFVAFVRGDEGQAILAAWGFGSADE